MDVMTPEQRSRCMSNIRGKDTKPEMVVRRLVHGMGYRYRLHDKRLPGRPDIVLPRLKKVIEVRGCFWHRHTCGLGYTPKNRREFWVEKLEGNRRRDKANEKALRDQGWDVLVIWECEVDNAEALAGLLATFLGGRRP